jgi:hypothetical protein
LQTKIILSLYFYKYNLFSFSNPNYDPNKVLLISEYLEGIQRITKLQKRATRIILDAPFFTPTQQLFDSLNWLPFRDRISYHKLILVYKILDNKTKAFRFNIG